MYKTKNKKEVPSGSYNDNTAPEVTSETPSKNNTSFDNNNIPQSKENVKNSNNTNEADSKKYLYDIQNIKKDDLSNLPRRWLTNSDKLKEKSSSNNNIPQKEATVNTIISENAKKDTNINEKAKTLYFKGFTRIYSLEFIRFNTKGIKDNIMEEYVNYLKVVFSNINILLINIY